MRKSFRVDIQDDDSPKKPARPAVRPHGRVDETAEEIADIVAEDVSPADAQDKSSQLEADVETLRAELEAARTAVEEEHSNYLRAMADFTNFKRRRQEEFESHVQFANQELILKLLPIMDNFERALQAAQEKHSFDALAEGVSLTLRQLQESLEKEGVKPIEAVGREFDPMMHEAVMRVESDEHPDNTVVEEVEKGYTQNSRVIRPARVKVAMK